MTNYGLNGRISLGETRPPEHGIVRAAIDATVLVSGLLFIVALASSIPLAVFLLFLSMN